MEGRFVSTILIYTLISFGLLFAALFKFRSQPNRYVLVGFWAVCSHIGYKLMWFGWGPLGQYELPIPFGLVYPMLLYLFARAHYTAKKAVSRNRLMFLSAPLLLHLMLFVIVGLQAASSSWTVVYAMIYYVSSMLSFLVYATLAARLSHVANSPSNPTDTLIRQLTVLCYGLVVLTYLVLYETSVSESALGFEIRPAVYLFLAIGFALIIRYVVAHGMPIFGVFQKNIREASPSIDEAKSNLPIERMPLESELVKAVERELSQTKLFLNPSVSLDMLAAQTSVPRHQLTQILSTHYGKSFYQFIAGMRIEYAVGEILKMEETVTLDSLSYACGFNSKTSFNRYFKAYTGMTPSEYRSTHRSIHEETRYASQ